MLKKIMISAAAAAMLLSCSPKYVKPSSTASAQSDADKVEFA